MHGRQPHIAGSPLMHLRAHDLREEHPAPPTDDANLRSEAHHQHPDDVSGEDRSRHR
jgi:hypothetical protein